ncbi:MAG TPA: vWA domain-containing protein [Candidatus Obscuribacterales bacterium]
MAQTNRIVSALCLAAFLALGSGIALAQQSNDAVDSNAVATPPPAQQQQSLPPQPPTFFVRPQQMTPPSTTSSPTAGQFLGKFLKSDFFSGQSHNILQLSPTDQRALSNSDLMIVIDHSGSMKTRDCPGFSFPGGLNSRLQWVVDELTIFSNQIIASMPHGFSLITFDNNPEVFQISNVDELNQVLSSLRPGGGTRLEAALGKAFQIHRAHMNQPLLIAVITDGEVNVRESEQTMAQGTREFPPPCGVAITILQVGAIAEQTTAGRIQALSSILPMGALYQPLTGVPFSQLRRWGLGNAVLFALRSSMSHR